jgi:hypothetical protein
MKLCTYIMMSICFWGCGEKEVPKTSITTKSQDTPQVEKKSQPNKNSNQQLQKLEKDSKDEISKVQLKYFDRNYIEKGSTPKYKNVEITYVSEQQILDDLYRLGQKQEHFYPCQSTGATFLSMESGKAKIQLKGGCGGCGTLGIYDHIYDTLRQLPNISSVQILSPNQKTSTTDRPSCLEP